MALVAGASNFGHYFLITLVVIAPLTRAESIRNYFLVLRIGLHRKKPAIHRFPSNSASPRAHKMQPVKVPICPCVGASPRFSWTSTYSIRCCSWIIENLCWDIWASCREILPFNRYWNIARGIPYCWLAFRCDVPFVIVFKTSWMSRSLCWSSIIETNLIPSLKDFY